MGWDIFGGVLCESRKKVAGNNEEEWSWINEKMGETMANVWEMDETEWEDFYEASERS